MSTAAWVGWTLALILVVVSLWLRRRRRRNPFLTRSGTIARPPKVAVMPNASQVLIYVNDDGSARELNDAEKRYVDTEFSPLDGARPYVKSSYEQRTPLSEIRGYLPRAALPDGVPIHPAPPEPAPPTARTAAESLSELIRKHTQR